MQEPCELRETQKGNDQMGSILGKAFPLLTRQLPSKQTGSRGLRYEFPLQSQTSYNIIVSLTESGLDLINGVFVDNSLNASAFTLTNPVTGQIVYVPAYSQGSLSLITTKSGDNQQFTGMTTGGVVVPVIFRNTEPVSDQIWSVLAPGQVAGAITVQGQVTAIPYVSAGIDSAGLIVTGGTSQLLFAANPARKSLFISNPPSPTGQGIAAVESLYISFGSPATNGGPKMIEVAPGGYFNPVAATDNRAVYIIGQTTNHAFTAIQYQ